MVTIYALLVCKIFGLKIRSCKFFDKSQVCTGVPYLVMSKWCWRGSYRSWAQFVYASHEQWKLEPSTPRVSQWRGMVYHPPSINYHDVKKSSWWHDVPHCSLPHCAMMYLLPTTMMLKRALDDMMYHIVLWHYDVSSSNYHGGRMSIEEYIYVCVPLLQRWPSVAAFFGITDIIFGVLLSEWKPSAHHFCYILSQGYQGFVSAGWSCIQRKSYKSSAHWYLSTHKDSRRGHNAEA